MAKNKDRWSALSMSERADLIKLYVSNGVTSLDDIKKDYNTFSEGGNTNSDDNNSSTIPETLSDEPIYYDDTYIEPSVVKAFKSQEEYNRFLGKKGAKIVREGTNKAAQNIYKGLQFAPILGDGIDAAHIMTSVKEGDLKKAGIMAGLILLPNFIEKPIKHIRKGFRNLALYSKYVRQPERFRSSVNDVIERYARNADLINQNYGLGDDFRLLRSSDFVRSAKDRPITTEYRRGKRRVGGSYDYNNNAIWLNPYVPQRIKKAWKSPKEAILELHSTAAHEGTHEALDYLGDMLSVYDPNVKYFAANTLHPTYERVGYVFDDMNREARIWERSPEEFIAEMNYFRRKHNIPTHLGYNQWKPSKKKELQDFMQSRFNINKDAASYVEPEDIDYVLSEYSNFGYKNGGKINRFETGGQKDKKQVEDVVRTSRGSTGKILTKNFPFVDVYGLNYLLDSWRVMKGKDEYVAPTDSNYTGVAMKGLGVQTDDGLGFVSQEDLTNTLGYTPKDFVDTFVYGDTPFEELGVFKKESSPERHVVRSKVKKVEDSGKRLNTYQTQRDTLDANTVAVLDSLLNAGKVDLHSENTTYQNSPFNIGDSGIIYDGNNSTVATAYLPNGMPVSKAIDVFDTDPKEWNYTVNPLAKRGLRFIHDNTNPFLMTTPWYYPIKSTDFLSRLYYLFGIRADRDYNVLSNKGDKNGVIWNIDEALEWLDNHPDLTEMPVKTKKD